MIKLTKTQVISKVKKLEEGEVLQVSLFPSKCGPANTTWVKGYAANLFHENGEIFEDISEDERRDFQDTINSFQYYNCIPELGLNIHYYIEEK